MKEWTRLICRQSESQYFVTKQIADSCPRLGGAVQSGLHGDEGCSPSPGSPGETGVTHRLG